MDLWIRDQDRTTLMKLRRIDVQDCYIICHEDDGYDDHIVYMGKYETEERALEVLDEIQNFIENNYESSIPSCNNNMIANGKIVLKTRRIVYELPKE